MQLGELLCTHTKPNRVIPYCLPTEAKTEFVAIGYTFEVTFLHILRVWNWGLSYSQRHLAVTIRQWCGHGLVAIAGTCVLGCYFLVAWLPNFSSLKVSGNRPLQERLRKTVSLLALARDSKIRKAPDITVEYSFALMSSLTESVENMDINENELRSDSDEPASEYEVLGIPWPIYFTSIFLFI